MSILNELEEMFKSSVWVKSPQFSERLLTMMKDKDPTILNIYSLPQAQLGLPSFIVELLDTELETLVGLAMPASLSLALKAIGIEVGVEVDEPKLPALKIIQLYRQTILKNETFPDNSPDKYRCYQVLKLLESKVGL